jgi:30S ribosomal protein S31
MGKGDIKSRRGKIHNGSYGVRRPRKAEAASVTAVAAPKAEKKAAAPKKAAAKKKA